MVHWMSKADSKTELQYIANAINDAWKSTLGTELMKRFINKINSPKNQVRNALKNIIGSDGIDPHTELGRLLYNKEEFESTSMTDLMAILTSLPEWEKIAEQLNKMSIDDGEFDNVEF